MSNREFAEAVMHGWDGSVATRFWIRWLSTTKSEVELNNLEYGATRRDRTGDLLITNRAKWPIQACAQILSFAQKPALASGWRGKPAHDCSEWITRLKPSPCESPCSSHWVRNPGHVGALRLQWSPGLPITFGKFPDCWRDANYPRGVSPSSGLMRNPTKIGVPFARARKKLRESIAG